jgi:protein O-GlcNAc transferase
MNIRAWADSLESSFFKWGTINAYPKVPLPYIEVLDHVQGMTTPSTMHLLNLAVQQLGEGECYLEVGTWRGATLIGALLGNERVHGIAIDNDTMNDHDGDECSSQVVWRKNVARFKMPTRSHYVDGSVPEVWEIIRPQMTHPIGVYLFDGDKSTEEAAYAGIAGVVPFLADEALIFVDDANEVNIRRAVYQFNRRYPNNVFTILDIPTPGNCWPCFWDGIMALAWKRG